MAEHGQNGSANISSDTGTPMLQSPYDREPSKGPWMGLGIGAVLITLVLGYLIWNSRTSESRYTKPTQIMSAGAADPYAPSLKVENIKMAQAQNFVGGESIYIEGDISNTGNKTVTGATIEVTFKNEMNQVVQREARPLMVVIAREPAIDVGALNISPLAPGQKKEFQVPFEHISQDWNRQYPEVRITTVTAK